MKIYTQISCESRNCQRLINKFLEKNIKLRRVKLKGDTLRFCIEDKNLKSATELIAATGARYCVEKRGGAELVKKLAVRYLSLIIPSIMCIVVLASFSKVCVGIKINCADSQISSQINDILAAGKVKPYTLKAKIDTKALSLKISSEIDKVGFANCYFDGGILNIDVKEVYKPDKKEEFSKIVADRDCIVTRVLLYSGTALVKEGDVVKKGDTLIEGYIYTAPDTEDNERLAVPADGVVYAQTAYSDRITLSAKVMENVRTGKSYKDTQLYLFGKRIGKAPKPKYQAYEYKEEAKIFGSVIPIRAVTRTYYQLETREVLLSDEQVDEQISLACIELWQQIPEEAKLLDNYTYRKKLDNLHIIDIYYIVEEIVSEGK